MAVYKKDGEDIRDRVVLYLRRRSPPASEI